MKVHISKNLSGKMSGIHAITTSKFKNKQCLSNSKIGNTSCFKCYADRALNAYSKFREHANENSKVLSSRLLDDHNIPRVDSLIFRLETHGDIINKTHLENYCLIASKNPRTRFTLWTKRVDIASSYFTHNEKPRNLHIIHSSLDYNVEDKIPFYASKVFTVYTKEFLNENANVKINCGHRSCSDCRLCYTTNKVKSIKEIYHK